MSQPRFEIVRSDAPQPWHARFVSGNGRIIMSSEKYTRKADAEHAMWLVRDAAIEHYTVSGLRPELAIEVRDVDERPVSEGSA